jgi:hypothetical protein
MSKLLGVVVTVLSLAACGSSGNNVAALPTAGTSQTPATESAQSSATTVAADVASTTEVRIELTSKDLVQLVCDVILIAEGEVGANPVAVPALYGPEFVRQLGNRLSPDQMAKGFDEAAVQQACPKDYADFLAKAHSTSLTGVSAP